MGGRGGLYIGLDAPDFIAFAVLKVVDLATLPVHDTRGVTAGTGS